MDIPFTLFFGADFCHLVETIRGKLLKPWVFSLKCICHKKFTTSVKSRLVKKTIALHHGNHSFSLLEVKHFLKKYSSVNNGIFLKIC
jgi:hypothetical protein